MLASCNFFKHHLYLKVCQQDSLTALCNIFLYLRMPEQIVCTVVAVQQDDLFGVHDHPA